MRPAPIADRFIWAGARRVVVGPPDGDLTSGEIGPVEALIDLPPGRDVPRLSVRCVLEDGDLEKLIDGGAVWISFYGGQMPPVSVDVVDRNGE